MPRVLYFELSLVYRSLMNFWPKRSETVQTRMKGSTMKSEESMNHKHSPLV